MFGNIGQVLLIGVFFVINLVLNLFSGGLNEILNALFPTTTTM